MTIAEIEALSGEDLRVAVATRVMGWELHPLSPPDNPCYRRPGETVNHRRLPRYESEIAAAFEVVEAMRKRGLRYVLEGTGDKAAAFFRPEGDLAPGWGFIAEGLPIAICRAALYVVGEEPA